jgi:hypothetical protein
MPGRITSYLFQMHQGLFGAPVVNLFFDGIGNVSPQVAVHLEFIARCGTSHRDVHDPGEKHSAPGEGSDKGL